MGDDGDKLNFLLFSTKAFIHTPRKNAPTNFSFSSSMRPRCNSLLTAEGDRFRITYNILRIF